MFAISTSHVLVLGFVHTVRELVARSRHCILRRSLQLDWKASDLTSVNQCLPQLHINSSSWRISTSPSNDKMLVLTDNLMLRIRAWPLTFVALLCLALAHAARQFIPPLGQVAGTTHLLADIASPAASNAASPEISADSAALARSLRTRAILESRFRLPMNSLPRMFRVQPIQHGLLSELFQYQHSRFHLLLSSPNSAVFAVPFSSMNTAIDNEGRMGMVILHVFEGGEVVPLAIAGPKYLLPPNTDWSFWDRVRRQDFWSTDRVVNRYGELRLARSLRQ